MSILQTGGIIGGNDGMAAFFQSLEEDLDKEAERQRKWDLRFLDLAALVASWSKDPSTKCGAVIVRPDKTIASVGFNGFPKGCSDDDEFYENRELKYARVVHAEVNSVLLAGEDVTGCTLYTWPPNIGPSCDRCTATVIQAGISRVVHKRARLEDEQGFIERWGDSIQRGLDMYAEAGVEVVSY